MKRGLWISSVSIGGEDRICTSLALRQVVGLEFYQGNKWVFHEYRVGR